ncbi:hypothetical protein QWY85_01340, partial [Neolewinella lacunae]
MGTSDTRLAVLSGTCDTELNCVATVFQTGGTTILANLMLNPGETYLVVVDPLSGGEGMFMVEACNNEVVCNDFTVTLDDNGMASVTAMDLAMTTCDQNGIMLSQSEFSCDDVGEVVVTVSQVDNGGATLTCESTVTVVDDGRIVFPDTTVYVSAESCEVVVEFPNAAGGTPPTFFQGFEDPAFALGGDDWNSFFSSLTREISGTDGIPSATGAAHGVADTVGSTAGQTGIFSRLGGYSTSFGTGFTVSLDVYMNLSDPGVINDTYGWDLSAAASNQSGTHLRDFIFHTASDGMGGILVGGSNNTNFTRRNDLATINGGNNYTITTTGWYTFEFVFRNQAGSLAVDLNLRDAMGTVLFTETRFNVADDIATIVGGNRYLWFTFLEVETLAIDNTSLTYAPAGPQYTFDPASGSAFQLGETEVIATNVISGCTDTFLVTVLDTIAPVIICEAIEVALDSTGNVTIENGDAVVSIEDNCGGNLSGPFTVGGPTARMFDCLDADSTYQRTVVATDMSGNQGSCTYEVTIIDTIVPVIVCEAIEVALDSMGMATIENADAVVSIYDNCPDDLSGPFTVGGPAARTFDCSFADSTFQRTVVITDASGNRGECTYDVTVIDNIVPVIVCEAITVALDSMGTAMIENDDAVVSIYDNCPDDLSGPFTVGGPAARTFDCSFADSTFQRTVVITDASGNRGECTYDVTVVDNIAPVIVSCVTDTTIYLDENGFASIAPGELLVTFDACPPLVLVGNPLVAFDCASAGESFVFNESDVDASGNVSEVCTITITVLDTVPPVALCQDVTIELDEEGNASIAAGATGTPTAVTQVTGMLDGMDPTFNRPVGGPGACSPSGVGTNVFYETFSFTISAADMYTFAFSGVDDLTAALYGGGFDPAAPCANILAYNDDGNGNLDPLIIIQLDLVPGDYTMVITTFGNGATSDYTMDISSANGGQVFAAGGGGG